MFTTQFDNYVCINDSIDCVVGPLRVTARVVFDDQSTPMEYDAPGCCFDTSDSEYGEENQKTIDAWCNDEWFYCGIVLSVVLNDSDHELTDHAAALWGIECNYGDNGNAYLMDVANELLGEAIDNAKEEIERIRESIKDI